MKYYIVPVWGCVEPEELIGPYTTYQGMLRRAKKIFANQKEEDALFWLRTGTHRPFIGTFSHGELSDLVKNDSL